MKKIKFSLVVIAALAFVATALFFKNQDHQAPVRNDAVAMKTPAPQPPTPTKKLEAKPAAVKLTVTDLNLTVKP